MLSCNFIDISTRYSYFETSEIGIPALKMMICIDIAGRNMNHFPFANVARSRVPLSPRKTLQLYFADLRFLARQLI